MNLLQEWNCDRYVVNLVLDTLVSNTGHVTAACITMQQHVQRALLWSACRHHVREIIIFHVFQDPQIEVSKSPAVALFPRLCKMWDKIPHDTEQPLKQLDLTPSCEEVQAMITDLKTEVLQLVNTQL